MKPVDPSARVKDLVLAQPGRAPLLDRLALDYFCRGDRTLSEACAERGLDAETIATVIGALDEQVVPARCDLHDIARATTWDLCAHLVTAHHIPLRAELGRIADLARVVARVHHDEHPELRDVDRLVARLRTDLERHLEVEEAVVFPVCSQSGEVGPARVDTSVLTALEADHAELCDTLAAVRELGDACGGRALCSTHGALLKALASLELELHHHIHEENNVLFARIRAA